MEYLLPFFLQLMNECLIFNVHVCSDCMELERKIEIVRVGEGNSKDLEKYTINSRLREKEEDKSASKTLRAEVLKQ